MRRLKKLLRHALDSPLIRRKWSGLHGREIADLEEFSREIPLMTLEEFVEEKKRSGDPYALRSCETHRPLVTFQLEYDTETRLYLLLDRLDLKNYAEALGRCWSLLGLENGDAVAIFDYGTSPASYLASSAFTPYLSRGAADRLGCLPVCNDGVANMSYRAVEILKFVRPKVLFLRGDCLEPFAVESERHLGPLSSYTRSLVVTENEGLLSKTDQNAYEKRLGLPIYRLLRIDAAMFFAMECPRCRLFHTWQDLYLVEDLSGLPGAAEGGEHLLAITNWFARTCPTVRYLSQVKGTVRPAGCPVRAKDIRIAV